MGRRRSVEKEAFWRLVLEEFHDSGLTVRAFCAREGLSEPSFYAWKRRLAAGECEKASEASRGLVAVEVIDAARADTLLELATPGGFTLRFPADIAPHQLSAVVTAITETDRC